MTTSASALCHRLEELAGLSDQLLAALDAGAEARVRDQLDCWRQRLAQLGDASLGVDGTPPPPEVLARMQEYTARVSVTNDRVRAWLSRPAEASAEELLHTPAGVARLADALLPTAWDRERDLLVLVGAGGGLLARELLARGQEQVLVFLPEGAPDDDLPRKVVSCRTLAELRVSVEQLPVVPRRGITHRLAGASAELQAEVGAILKSAIEAVLTNRNTIERHGAVWVRQGLDNLPAIASWPSITALANGSFAGTPCVIVAAGPSLDKNLHLLPALKGKALIIALNRSLGALHRAGVVPDLVMIVDPADLRYHFEGVPVAPIGALVLGATVHPSLYELPARRILTYAGNSRLEHWIYSGLGESAELDSAGSVATSAFTLALTWGCDPITLVGQDLAFQGTQVYAAMAPDGSARVQVSADGQSFVTDNYSAELARLPTYGGPQSPAQRLLELPGYHGGTVQTSFSLRLFHRWFETTAQAVAQRPTPPRLLNCTEGGAYIEGMEHLPLAEAIARHMQAPLDVEGRLEGAVAGMDRAARRARMRAQVEEMHDAVATCVHLARRCARLAEKTLRRPELLPKLDAAEKELVAALQPVLFISLLEQEELRAAREAGQAARTLKASLAASRRFFALVERAGAVVRPGLAKSLAALAPTKGGA